MALGAKRSDVLKMMVLGAVKLAGGGLAIGLPVAFVLMRLLASLLVGVIRLDLPALLTLTVVLAIAAAIAGYLPTRRAAQVDPISALRDE